MNDVVDLDLPLLLEVVTLLDEQLERVQREAELSDDPDAEGMFDRADYVVGLGLVACQAYLAARAGWASASKSASLERGPVHRCGRSIASLVNAAANYWKHAPETALESGGPAVCASTINALSALGIYPGTYVASNALLEIVRPHPARLAHVVPSLCQWRDSVG